MKKNLLNFSILFVFFLMLAFPSITRFAAINGLNLWLFTILPALLPYTIISSLLLLLDVFYFPCKIFNKLLHKSINKNKLLIFTCGYLCGCPIGAKLAADSYKLNTISKNDAEFYMCTCNNLSPSFLINYAFSNIYSHFHKMNSQYSLLFFLILILSSILSSFITNYLYNHFRIIKKSHSLEDFYKNTRKSSQIQPQKKPEFSKVFEDCILSSFEIQAKIGGYIIILTIIINLFLYTLNLSLINSAILGSIIEITSGLNFFINIPQSYILYDNFPIIPALNGLIAFGGICTIMQTKSVIADTNLSLQRYIISKIISGIIAFLISLFIF